MILGFGVMNFSMLTESRNNNFNLLRIIASISVLVSHSFALVSGASNSEPLVGFFGFSLGTLAVDVFFVVSGFLVCRSLLFRDDLVIFLTNRMLRIFPGLLFAMFFSVILLGVLLSTHDVQDYFSDSQPYLYVLKNSTLLFGLEGNLPGVFAGNPLPNEVNGSLWTLPWEVRMYSVLFFLGLLASIFRSCTGIHIPLSRLIVLCSIIFIFFHQANSLFQFFDRKSIESGLRLLSMFFIGSSIYILRDRIVLSSHLFLGVCVSVFMAGHFDFYFLNVYSLLFPYLVVYIAFFPFKLLQLYNKVGDYSYGMYIFAFPIQQSALSLFPNSSVLFLSVVAFIITTFFSVFSWHFIEKPILDRKLVVAEGFVRRLKLIVREKRAI